LILLGRGYWNSNTDIRKKTGSMESGTSKTRDAVVVELLCCSVRLTNLAIRLTNVGTESTESLVSELSSVVSKLGDVERENPQTGEYMESVFLTEEASSLEEAVAKVSEGSISSIWKNFRTNHM
jgi:hypothetical protein